MAEKTKSRESILEKASELFFIQGYHATGLNQIIKESECPKGSLYYYFPNGKEELALECIERTNQIVIAKWKDCFQRIEDPVKAIQAFIQNMADDAQKCEFKGFMPFSFWLAVETSSISKKLKDACQNVFGDWQAIIAEGLQRGGYLEESKAMETATVIVSMLEGALILAQTAKDKRSLETVSKYVPCLVIK
jgi:TetR/AcrR family transcriptional repressor of lmrAB and yxaGH operons